MGSRLAAGQEVSGMACVLRTTILPSLRAIFAPGLPSFLRTRFDFVRGKLILSGRCLAQRRKTKQASR